MIIAVTMIYDRNENENNYEIDNVDCGGSNGFSFKPRDVVCSVLGSWKSLPAAHSGNGQKSTKSVKC